MIFARIESGIFVERFNVPEGKAIDDFFPSSLTWVNIENVSPQPQPGWALSGSVWTPPPAPQPNYGMIAKAALDASDITVIRCLEHSVAVPAEWIAYRALLRATVNNGAGPIPAMPAYPAGT